MFDAALKEKFNRLEREYAPDIFFEIWLKTMESRFVKNYFKERGWNLHMTIEQALDRLDEYLNLVEDIIKNKKSTDLSCD